MENNLTGPASELAEDLSQLDRAVEKSKALHLEISELMLSFGDCGPREWIQIPASSKDVKI
jgi:hypothetical protein